MRSWCLLLFLPLATALLAGGDKTTPARFATGFDDEEVGALPDGLMEIDGVFKVAGGDGGAKYLEMAAEPLTENAVILGPSIKGAATVEARVRSFRKRRSYPRFGIGLHGISGYRLRVVPSKGEVELVKNEEPVKSIPYRWSADSWTHLKLSVRAAEGDGRWRVEGSVWADGEEAPAGPVISLVHEGSPGQGKASLWGTAYSGKVVQFDDVAVQPGE